MTPGIYMFTCSKNGDRYIGSSSNIENRRRNHVILLKNKKHHNKHFQNIWNKYGEDSFSFELIEVVDDLSKLIEREQFWIDLWKPEINKAIKAESGFLGLKHKKETKEMLKNIQKNRLKSQELIEALRRAAIEQNKKHPNPMKGRSLSEDQKKHLREMGKRQFESEESRKKHSDLMKKWMTPEMRKRISKAKIGKKQSEETKKKRSKSLQRAWNNYTNEQKENRINKTKEKVVSARAKLYEGFVSPSGEVYENVYNMAEFCRIHGLTHSSMIRLDKGFSKTHKGWKKI